MRRSVPVCTLEVTKEPHVDYCHVARDRRREQAGEKRGQEGDGEAEAEHAALS